MRAGYDRLMELHPDRSDFDTALGVEQSLAGGIWLLHERATSRQLCEMLKREMRRVTRRIRMLTSVSGGAKDAWIYCDRELERVVYAFWLKSNSLWDPVEIDDLAIEAFSQLKAAEERRLAEAAVLYPQAARAEITRASAASEMVAAK